LLLGSKTGSTNGGTDEEHMTTGLGGVQMAANPATKHSGGPEEWEPHLGGERVVEGIHYGWLMKDHLARYHFAAQYCRGMRVLDVATGTGYGANILRQSGAAEVVAVDREQSALNYAADRYGTSGIRWVNGDACALQFKSEFDVVVSFETIEHLKDPDRFVRECKRVLKPGGMYIVSTPENAGGPLVSDFHEFEYTREEFRAQLQKHFHNVVLLGQRRELAMKLRPLRKLPEQYWETKIRQGRGSHRLFTFLDRLNKAPNYALAWATGLGESFRKRIRPIEEPLRRSSLLKPHYFAMIGLCKESEAPHVECKD
jgi:2-polyprenyl-3-methyl-5-hydroxy-6-metoxy-1,4-benzoquinol methylase